ncbi:MAG: hypothetical protein CL902_00535 [Dehalococcoidia bacterium]|nr:hypothetical protein [Dehalococcoidia bacterium]
MLASALRHIYMEEKWNPDWNPDLNAVEEVSTEKSSPSSSFDESDQDMRTDYDESTATPEEPVLFGGGGASAPVINYTLLGTSLIGMVGTLGAICI